MTDEVLGTLGGGAYLSVSVVQLSLSSSVSPFVLVLPRVRVLGVMAVKTPPWHQKKEYWLSMARGALAPSRSSSSTASSW